MPIVLSAGEEYPLSVQLTPVAPPPPDKARLYGYITDDTNSPIAGATVFLYQAGVLKYYGNSDSQGYYDITDIEPGTYDGIVTAAGYEDYPF